MSWLIVGLGNPTQKYKNTRHNAGYWFVEFLAEHFSVNFQNHKLSAKLATFQYQGQNIYLIKPTQYMNHSGMSVRQFVDYYKISLENVLICHDELDFQAGIIRFKKSGSAAGHNGIKDIIKSLNTQDFLRLRIGIGSDRSEKNTNSSGKDYVLSSPNAMQKQAIYDSFEKAIVSVKCAISEGSAKAIAHLHTS